MAQKKRLIDANDLRAQFDDIPPFIGLTGGCVQQYIDKTPTVDAEEVVHCFDCKHCDPENRHCDHPMATTLPIGRKPDDFCSYGERKDNG